MSKNKKLTIDEKQEVQIWLQKNYDKYTMVEMSNILNIPRTTLTGIAQGMGLTKGKVKDIDEYIIDNYHSSTVTQLAKDLKVTRNTVKRHAEALGLKKYQYYVRQPFEIECELKEFDPILDRYIITSHGRIYNKDTGYVLRTKIARGYEKISFKIDNEIYYYLVHRLIAFFFVPSSNQDYNVINHRDGVKHNNHIFNLEWTTIEYNTQHAGIYGLMKRGEEHSSSKMTEQQAMQLIEFYNNGGTPSLARKEFDFATRSIAQKIYSKQRWKHLSEHMKW